MNELACVSVLRPVVEASRWEMVHLVADGAVILAVLVGVIELWSHRRERRELAAAIDDHIRVLAIQAWLQVQAEASAPVGDFTIGTPKGKDIPTAVRSLIDRELGRDSSSGAIERRFKEFTESDALRTSLATWYTKKHAKKKLKEVELADYVSYLDTAAAKKLLKDWLDAEARREKATKEA